VNTFRYTTRYTVTVPRHYNDGEPLSQSDNDRISHGATAVGAYTLQSDLAGQWTEKWCGTVYNDRVDVYTFDAEARLSFESDLLSFARMVCMIADQECVYVTRHDAAGFATAYVDTDYDPEG
jgi:hypothetical protein